MKVLLGTSLALLVVAATPVFAASGDTIGAEGGEGMYSENEATSAPEDTTSAPATAPADRADRGNRAERRADREARRAARAERRAHRGERGDRAERRAQRGERGDRAERRAQRGERGDRAGRGHKRQFAMGDRVPRKFLAGRRVIKDYARFRVHAPQGGDQWVRGRRQLLLVSADGVVKNVVVRQKRRNRDRDRGYEQAPDQTVH